MQFLQLLKQNFSQLQEIVHTFQIIDQRSYVLVKKILEYSGFLLLLLLCGEQIVIGVKVSED